MKQAKQRLDIIVERMNRVFNLDEDETNRQRQMQRMEEHYPWVKEITLSDYEFVELAERDLGAVFLASVDGYREYWGWLVVQALKYFYQTGKFVSIDSGYCDGQNEYNIQRIMQRYGAGWEEIISVLDGKETFVFLDRRT